VAVVGSMGVSGGHDGCKCRCGWECSGGGNSSGANNDENLDSDGSPLHQPRQPGGGADELTDDDLVFAIEI
jgi:hypothetical protein